MVEFCYCICFSIRFSNWFSKCFVSSRSVASAGLAALCPVLNPLLTKFECLLAMLLETRVCDADSRKTEFVTDRGPHLGELLDATAQQPCEALGLLRKEPMLPLKKKQIGICPALCEREMTGRGDVVPYKPRQHRQRALISHLTLHLRWCASPLQMANCSSS